MDITCRLKSGEVKSINGDINQIVFTNLGKTYKIKNIAGRLQFSIVDRKPYESIEIQVINDFITIR